MKYLTSGPNSSEITSAQSRKGSQTTSFFEQNKKKILGIITSGLIAGCGGGEGNHSIDEGLGAGERRAQKMSSPPPLATIPTSAPFEVDGIMGYGWIYFEHPLSGYATGPYINPFQTNNYNPRDVLTRLGTTEWIIVRAAFSYDIDRNNDGKNDPNWTPINAGMSMLVHRSVLEKGEKILFSPRSAFISEMILTRTRSLTQGVLDSISRETGIDDTNNDGIIGYSDITTKKWATTGEHISLPGFGAYMESVYVNNGINRGNAIRTLQKMQNHTILEIIPNSSTHDPMLQISTLGTGTLLYTLDGSTPIPGGSTTLVSSSPLTLSLQDKKIYYRERIGTGASQILGKVKSFDLATDWMELSQDRQQYNPYGKEAREETPYNYNGKSYTLKVISNKSSPGYTYPKFLDCHIGTNLNEGCHLGPYVAFTELHEAKIRELIHKAAQEYINGTVAHPTNPTNPSNPITTTPIQPTHYQNEITTYTNKIAYLGGWYQVGNQWNLTGTKDYPVTILGSYATPDGVRQPNITATANDETERLNFSQAMVGKLKAIIEAKYANLPKPTYSQNQIISSDPVPYKGQTYTLFTTMNTTGYSDYPARVKVVYTTPAGKKETPSLPAKDATELTKVQNERISEAKSQIDMALGLDEYPAYHSITITPWRYYAGGKYTTKFTYSGTAGADYPGYIDVFYQKSNGVNGKWTMLVKSEAEKNLFIPHGEEQAKLEIDNYPLWPANKIVSYGNIPYGSKGGTYTRYEKFNRVGTGYNYPALVWIEYRPTSTSPLLDTRNTYGLSEARNSAHLAELRGTLETWVKGQMIALSPLDAPTRFAGNSASKFLDIIVPNAHAQYTQPSIVIKSNPTKLTPLSPYSTDISFYKTYNIGNPVQDFFMKPGFTAPTGKSKVNVVGRSEEEARVRGIKKQIESSIAKIDEYIKRLPGDSYRCTGMGLTMQEKCINEQYPGIEGILHERQAAIDAFNNVLKQETLSMEDGIQFIVDMFNNKGEVMSTKKAQLGLENSDSVGTMNILFAKAVASKDGTNFKHNTRLPIVEVSGDILVRGLTIDGTTITASELGNLSVGYLGGKAGFSLEHILENSRNVNMFTYIKQGYTKAHALNLATINETADRILYKSGFEQANIGRYLTKSDILMMFKKYLEDYMRILGTEGDRINKYKRDNGLL